MSLSWILLFLALALALSFGQTLISRGIGSDSSAHWLLINGIRKNRGRLFTIVPGLLNRTTCAANPLYLHRLLARIPLVFLPQVELLLNPIMLVLSALLLMLIQYNGDLVETNAQMAIVAVLYLLTPQFFHAFSARNFGISSRALGGILFTIFYYAIWEQYRATSIGIGTAIPIAVAALIFGTNLFAQQALVLTAIVLALIFGNILPLLNATFGFGIFFAFHPKYSSTYVTDTIRFLRLYKDDLAPRYILAKRYSIWGDLAFEIWSRLRENFTKGLIYAYGNSILIALFLNPAISNVILMNTYLGNQETSLVRFSWEIAVSGIIVFLATSFRKTRFLGEPERYVEIVTPWAFISSIKTIEELSDRGLVVPTILCLLSINVLQVLIAYRLRVHLTSENSDLKEISQIISSEQLQDVRLCSNNEHITKMMMKNDWKFACNLVAGQDYAGLRTSDCYSEFPVLKPTTVLKVVGKYDINVCILDRTSCGESSSLAESLGRYGFQTRMNTKRYMLLVRRSNRTERLA
jgi:hypothetical protein